MFKVYAVSIEPNKDSSPSLLLRWIGTRIPPGHVNVVMVDPQQTLGRSADIADEERLRRQWIARQQRAGSEWGSCEWWTALVLFNIPAPRNPQDHKGLFTCSSVTHFFFTSDLSARSHLQPPYNILYIIPEAASIPASGSGRSSSSSCRYLRVLGTIDILYSTKVFAHEESPARQCNFISLPTSTDPNRPQDSAQHQGL